MNLERKEAPDGVIIEVTGDVDMESSPKLRDEIKSSLKSKPAKLKLHLAGVPYIDSSGIAVLIEGMKWCAKKGAAYSLVSVSDSVKAVLELSKLTGVFSIEEA